MGIIERAARALCELQIRNARRWDTSPEELEALLPEGVDYSWTDHVPQARAVLSALREPDEGMIEAGSRGGDVPYAADIWQAMIDQALKG